MSCTSSNAERQALAQGLEAVVEVARRWPLAAERLQAAYLRSYYEGVVRFAIGERPSLHGFDREKHERALAEFRSLDAFKLKHNRARVRRADCRRLPSFASAAGNLFVLRQQCELTRRHKPIRWIMKHAGEAVMQLKPVFMMSPLSAAIHLPPEMPPFDVVIFDEASQVRPEDALCAIVRAKQTIVVGDTRQVPPSCFFDRVLEDDDDTDAEEDDEGAQMGREARKQESVLSLMSAAADSLFEPGDRDHASECAGCPVQFDCRRGLRQPDRPWLARQQRQRAGVCARAKERQRVVRAGCSSWGEFDGVLRYRIGTQHLVCVPGTGHQQRWEFFLLERGILDYAACSASRPE